MILLRDLNPETKKLLTRISRVSQFPQVRNRAKFIILSDRGLSLTQLMQLFGVSRRTLYNWLNRWEKQGIVGLYNQKGRGRKAKLSQEQKDQRKDWVKAEPKSLKKVISKIYKTWELEVSKETIKRIIKKWKFLKYEWIEVDAYENWKSLLKYLKKVLDNLGQEYAINFV